MNEVNENANRYTQIHTYTQIYNVSSVLIEPYTHVHTDTPDGHTHHTDTHRYRILTERYTHAQAHKSTINRCACSPTAEPPPTHPKKHIRPLHTKEVPFMRENTTKRRRRTHDTTDTSKSPILTPQYRKQYDNDWSREKERQIKREKDKVGERDRENERENVWVRRVWERVKRSERSANQLFVQNTNTCTHTHSLLNHDVSQVTRMHGT